MKILLVDDDVAVLQTFARLLEIDGHKVLRAVDGYVGFGLLAKNRDIELVITDYNMPVWSGHRLAREAKKFCRVPVILHTSEIKLPHTPFVDLTISKGETDKIRAFIKALNDKKEKPLDVKPQPENTYEKY